MDTFGLIPSVKQAGLRRRPALRQAGGFRCSRFLIQVREYLRDHRRVLDAGDETDITTAVAGERFHNG